MEQESIAISNSLPVSAATAHGPSLIIDAAQIISFPNSLNGVGLACSSSTLPDHKDSAVSFSPSTTESTASSPIAKIISASDVSCDKYHDHGDWESGSNSPSNSATSSSISAGFSPSSYCTDYHTGDTVLHSEHSTNSIPLTTN